MKTILAWHFLSKDHILNYKDGRKAVEGETLSCKGDIELCSNGMHASTRIIDALCYAKSSELSLVEISGDIKIGDDKIAGRSRKVIEIYNIDDILFEFACSEAELALNKQKELGNIPHKDSYAAIKASRDYRQGLISREELWAAGSAAYLAAESAAYSAAESAAGSAAYLAAESAAAWSAAYSAAESAAESAAYLAAGSAAYLAAGSAAWSDQSKRLTKELSKLFSKTP